ncbi:hypothetical protein MRB53_030562 [Persea americana]|uniref:Uncharacterized protein n=1 Tax=Persea americana TaxID=3435 RepID=A0ACC2KM88_PERAE|nr:hypothetical protein MRB53_030562 [Persea americana]
MAGGTPPPLLESDDPLKNQIRLMLSYAEDRPAKISLIRPILKRNQEHALPADFSKDLILEAKVRSGKRFALLQPPIIQIPSTVRVPLPTKDFVAKEISNENQGTNRKRAALKASGRSLSEDQGKDPNRAASGSSLSDDESDGLGKQSEQLDSSEGLPFHESDSEQNEKGWRLSVYSTPRVSIGVLWDEADHPIEGAIHSAMDYYLGILRFVDLIPAHLPSILIEVDYSLVQILRLPQTSPWKVRFQVRSIVAALKHFHLTFVDIQPSTVRFSRKLCRNRLIPSHISNVEIGMLWRLFDCF